MLNKILISCFIIIAFVGNSQDIHFSQFTNAPLQLNPALTGYTECNLRIGFNYRNQWNSISSPYITHSAYIDGKFMPASFKRDWFGVGGLFISDKAGDGNLSDTKGMIFLSYNKSLNADKTLIISLGAGLGLVNRSVDYTKLTFDNQWDGTGFSFLLPSMENYKDNSIFYFDFNGGLLLSYLRSSNFGFYAGVSLHHINKPDESFYDIEHRIGRNTIIHGGMLCRLGDNLKINPQLVYSNLRKSSEFLFGANLCYEYKLLCCYLGGWYRMSGAAIPTVGIEYNNFCLMLSYDLITSDLSNGTNRKGGIEFSLVKKILCGNNKTNNIIK